MSSPVVFVDTSILVELLEVPGKSSAAGHAQVLEELTEFIAEDAQLLLPVATIIETGNHIAQLSNGHHRRDRAGRLRKLIQQAIDGEAPFSATRELDLATLVRLLPKLETSAGAGVGIADLSLVDALEQQRALRPSRKALIWTRDAALAANNHP